MSRDYIDAFFNMEKYKAHIDADFEIEVLKNTPPSERPFDHNYMTVSLVISYHNTYYIRIYVASLSKMNDNIYNLHLHTSYEFSTKDLENHETVKKSFQIYHSLLKEIVREAKRYLGADESLDVFPVSNDDNDSIVFAVKYKDRLFFKTTAYYISIIGVEKMRDKDLIITANAVRFYPSDDFPNLTRAYERFMSLYDEYIRLSNEGEKYKLSAKWHEKLSYISKKIEEKYGYEILLVGLAHGHGYKKYGGKLYFPQYNIPFDVLEKIYNEYTNELEKLIPVFKKELVEKEILSA